MSGSESLMDVLVENRACTGPTCQRCSDTGWVVRHYYVCDCRAGDHAWAKWEGMTIEEYDRRAAGAKL